MSDGGQVGIREPDSEGCLLIVGSYSDVVPKVAPAAAEAAKRIMMSPVLGDFIDLRMVDIGPRPVEAGMPTAVSRIARELTRPSSGAERTYFALVIADRSAATVEQVIEECDTNQIIAALPIRYRGVASVDDRRPGAEAAGGSGRVTNVMIATAGSWNHGDLVDVLRRYAQELLSDFAAGQTSGLTGEQLDLLRPGNEEGPITGASGSAGNDSSLEPQPTSLDVLIPQEEPSPGTSARPVPRRRPARPRRRRRAAEPGADDSAFRTQGESGTAGLVFLILTGDESPDDRGSWRRGRSVLLELDKKIGTAPGIAYQVRVLQSNEDTTKSALRRAGQLSRHDIKRSAADLDFAQVLGIAREVMKRDLTVLKLSAKRVARPAIVFFAADAPLAEPIAVEEYDKLAQEASITWVMPEHLADLISPVFAGGDARIIIDHKAVADEVFNLLCGSKTSG
jgi:hypothetical protein